MQLEKKIIILVPTLRYGGGERVSVNLINGFLKNNYLVTLILFDDKQIDYEISKKVKIISLNEKTDISNYFLKIFAFAKKIFKLKKILKHSNSNILSIMPSMNILSILSKNKNQRLIITEHNILRKDTLFNKVNLILKKVLYQKADSIVAVSNGVKKNLEEEIKKLKVVTIFNPLNINEIIRLSNIKIQNNYGDYIVGVGRLNNQKGFDLLIESLSQLSNKKINLLIIGDGEEKQNLIKLTKKLNISERVFFLGFIDNPYSYMKNAKFFILSSRYEGFGMVVAEALISNANIISFNCKYGPSEILKNGELGVLVNKIDANTLANVMNNELRETNSTKKNLEDKDLSRFDINHIIKSYEKLLYD